MNQPARPGPPPARRGAFEPDKAAPKPKPAPRQLPQAPQDDGPSLSLGQIAGAAILVVCGIGLIGFFALGLPIEAIGGKAVLVIPAIGLVFFLRASRRRR